MLMIQKVKVLHTNSITQTINNKVRNVQTAMSPGNVNFNTYYYINFRIQIIDFNLKTSMISLKKIKISKENNHTISVFFTDKK